MTARRERTATLPPRLIVRAAWVLHRGLYRVTKRRHDPDAFAGLLAEHGPELALSRLIER